MHMHKTGVIQDLVSSPLPFPSAMAAEGKLTSKSWEITINNYTEEDINWVMDLDVSSCCISKEVGEEGTPHLQGRITFKRAYRLAQLKKLHPKAHWDITKCGSDTNYFKKLGSEKLREVTKAKRQRTDIQEIRDELIAGDNIQEIMKKARTQGQVQFAEKWYKYMGDPLPKGTKIQIFWYYGCTGTGKTRRVLDQCDPFIPTSHKWWDGYEGQDSVLLDDIRADWCKPAELLRLIDPYRYQYRVEIKGGVRHLIATKIWVTCPWHPRDFWKDTDEDPGQILRRLTELVHFRADGEWQQPLV